MSDDVSERGLDLILSTQPRGVLVTLKRNGRPQLSVVAHWYDPDQRLLRISVTADRAKTKNIARDGRVGYHVIGDSPWKWAAAEGDAELSPIATEPSDATVDELVDIYRAVAGEHPNWDEFRSTMVAERRLVLRITVTKVYGQP